MKKVLNIIVLMALIPFLTFACSNSSGETNKESTSEPSLDNISNSSTGYICFEQFYGNPEELLTKDLVGAFIDFAGAEVEVEKVSEQIVRDKDYATVNCKWRIERERHIVRLQSIFKIKLYDRTPVEQFYFKYHTRTAEEKAAQKKALDDQVKKETTNENADNVTGAIGFDFQYLNIENLGDAAVWEHKVNSIIVLVDEYQFTVNVDLKKDNELNLEKAKLIAQAIIDKACK